MSEKTPAQQAAFELRKLFLAKIDTTPVSLLVSRVPSSSLAAVLS
jgi:hypothetical protein